MARQRSLTGVRPQPTLRRQLFPCSCSANHYHGCDLHRPIRSTSLVETRSHKPPRSCRWPCLPQQLAASHASVVSRKIFLPDAPNQCSCHLRQARACDLYNLSCSYGVCGKKSSFIVIINLVVTVLKLICKPVSGTSRPVLKVHT